MSLLRRLAKSLEYRLPYLFLVFSAGLKNSYAEFKNARRGWSAFPSADSSIENSGTSISDDTLYIQLCDLAVASEGVFSKFKSSREYRVILEHCTFQQGQQYLDLIKDSPARLEALKTISECDIGNPYTYFYKGFGWISPTQIRYAKVLQDLELLFGNLDEFKIAEIGVGYGGQSIHILNKWMPETYTLYDLPQPAALAMKYVDVQKPLLRALPLLGNYRAKSFFDLVISNYAFSELFKPAQELYYDNVIANSRRGYMIYNQIHSNPNDSMSVYEIAGRIPGAQIFEEIPLTYPGNVLLVWGHNPNSSHQSLIKVT